MIGWQDEAKTLFLATVLGSGIMSLILMLGTIHLRRWHFLGGQ